MILYSLLHGVLVFCQVASKRFVDIGTSQYEQTADFASCPWEQLGKHISYHHT
jgi:hypothetical protein